MHRKLSRPTQVCSISYQLSSVLVSESLFSILLGERQTDHHHPCKLVKDYGIAFLLSPLNPSFLHSYIWKIINLLLVKALLFPNLGPLCWGFYFCRSNLNHFPTPLPAVALLPLAFPMIFSYLKFSSISYFPESTFVISQPPSRLWPCCPLLAPGHMIERQFPLLSPQAPMYHTATIPHTHTYHTVTIPHAYLPTDAIPHTP